MNECPLKREFERNPMLAREFAENHHRLPTWLKAFIAMRQKTMPIKRKN